MAAATAVTAIAIDAMLPALAEVRDAFGIETAADTALVVSVFILALGLGHFIYGPLADRFGRKPVLRAGLVLYIVAGIAATFAPSFGFLLAARFVWGLGSASPRIVAQAIMRDRFSGDTLSRALAFVVAIFLIVPTLAPIIGQVVLTFGSWRYTFAVGPVFALLVLIWTVRLDETLAVEARRSITPRQIGRALVTIATTPSAASSAIALTLLNGAFLPYLGSSERIYDLIYGRGDVFFAFFAGTAALMAGLTVLSARIVKSIGTWPTTRIWLGAMVVTATVFTIVAVSSEGVPPFWLFVLFTTALVGFDTALIPLLTSASLEDVPEIAGTTASTVGAVSLVGGALISGVIDRAIDTTVTPFSLGYLVLSVMAILALRAWRSTPPRAPKPE